MGRKYVGKIGCLFRLFEPTHEAFKAAAKEDGVDKSELLEKLIVAYLARRERARPKPKK